MLVQNKEFYNICDALQWLVLMPYVDRFKACSDHNIMFEMDLWLDKTFHDNLDDGSYLKLNIAIGFVCPIWFPI